MKVSHRRPVPHTAARAARVRESSPRKRAFVKIAVLLALINQILTSAFAFLAHENHPEVAQGLTLLFSLALFVILIVWIRQDAKRAWQDACESGFVSPCVIQGGRTVRIRRGCARRWLVALHVELQGGFASKA